MKIARSRRLFNAADDTGLPLFSWAANRNVPVSRTRAGRKVQERTGLPPRRAELVATLAGLGPRHD
jgi:hypothetical protein